MELQAVTGQFFVIDGMAQTETAVPGLLAQPAPSKAARERKRDYLFIHLTLSGNPLETAPLAQELLKTISDGFYQATGSVTAALRKAIIIANDLLLRLNLASSGATREGAITCSVLRNGELFTLQTGEALALLGHNFGIERLPPQEPSRITPLGRTAGLDFRFYHHRLQDGNMLLLMDPRLAHLPTDTLESVLVDTEVEMGLDALNDIVGDASGRLLLVEFTNDLPGDLLNILPTAVTTTATTQAPVPSPIPRRTTGTAVPASPASENPVNSAKIAADVENTARLATSKTAMGFSRFTGWLADVLAKIRPPHRKDDEPATNWIIPTLLAIIIPLLIAVIVTSVYLQRGRSQRFADIKVEIGQNIAQAEESGDDAIAAREHYNRILELAAEADTLRPDDNEIERLRQETFTKLDRLDNVTRLVAQPLYNYDESAYVSSITLQDGFNGGIYTLDRTNNAVYRHDTDQTYLNLLNPEPEQLLFGGQAIGSHVVGAVVDSMWRPRGTTVSRDGLATLDANGALLTFYPDLGDIRAVPLGLASEWVTPIAITGFNERLYILDNNAGKIWKYFPDGEGFVPNDKDRAIEFDTKNADPDVRAMIDFDIYSEDGSLVALYGDGRIRYYDTRSGRIQWNENDLMQNGLISPLISPIAVKMIGRGLNASIFVADPGSGRIIQISRAGTVLAQYRATDDTGWELFSRTTDFAIAENPLRIFTATPTEIWVSMLE